MKQLLFTLIFLWSFMTWTSGQTSQIEYGEAIYYADYLHGKKTALGEYYDKFEMTAAHRTHPLGTLVKVTRRDDGRSVTVRVNDRGPYANGCPNCLIDLSWAAADQIGLTLDGKTSVHLEVVGFSNTNPPSDYIKYRNGSRTETAASNQGGPVRMSTSTVIPKNSDLPQSYGAEDGRIAPLTPPVSTNSYASEAYGSTSSDSRIKRIPAGQLGYGVQVASYGNLENAQRQILSMQQRGLSNVYLKEALQYDGSTLFRVIVGVYESRSGAASMLQSLKMNYQVNGFVINLSN